MDPLERSRSAQQARAAPFGAGDGVGFSVRVHGDMLPRSVAVNDSTIRPILLASGPAVRWVLRQYDAPPDTPNTQALSQEARRCRSGRRGRGGADRRVAGETLMMVIEAVDDSGTVDVDFDVVCFSTRGARRGAWAGQGRQGARLRPARHHQVGGGDPELRDGGFDDGTAAADSRRLQGWPAGDDRLHTGEAGGDGGRGDRRERRGARPLDNVSPTSKARGPAAATHGATWGDEPVKLEAGVAQIDLVSEQAGTITLSCVGVTGDKAEMFPNGLSNVAHLRYTPGNAACSALLPTVRSVSASPASARSSQRSPTRTATRSSRRTWRPTSRSSRAHWQRERRARWLVPDRRRRGGGCTRRRPRSHQFWITSSAAGGMVVAVIRHTEDEPLRGDVDRGGIAQFGLYLPSDQPVHVGGEEKMIVGVRTEDAFGNLGRASTVACFVVRTRATSTSRRARQGADC